MAVPPFESFMFPTLSVLSAETELPIAEVYEYVAIEMNLSDADMAELVRGGSVTKFKDRVSWALAYMFQAGLVERPKRAVYLLTGEGLALLKEAPDRIDRALLPDFTNVAGECHPT